MKKIFLLLLLSVFIGSITGCSFGDSNSSKKSSPKDYPVKIDNVTIKSRPSKVAVLSDTLADIAIDLGFIDQIVARSSKCTQEEISSITDVSSQDNNINLELIKSLHTEVVLYENELSDIQINSLKDSSIVPIKIERAKERNDLERVYANVGRVFNGSETGYNKGVKGANNILMTLDDITRIVPKQTIPIKACYLFDENGTTIQNPSFESQLIEAVGLINIIKEVNEGKADIEGLILSNPNWILCDAQKKDYIINNPQLASTDAVKNGQVIEVDSLLLRRQGKSIIDVATYIAGKIYPELLNDSPSNEIRAEANSIVNQAQNNSSKDEYVTVNFGDEGEDVLKIQNRLDDLNYLHTAPNSKFDSSMAQAIKDFKLLNGMTVTQDVDQKFMDKLFSRDAVVRPDPAREK